MKLILLCYHKNILKASILIWAAKSCYLCVSGGKKRSFFGKFGVLCILVTSVLKKKIACKRFWCRGITTLFTSIITFKTCHKNMEALAVLILPSLTAWDVSKIRFLKTTFSKNLKKWVSRTWFTEIDNNVFKRKLNEKLFTDKKDYEYSEYIFLEIPNLYAPFQKKLLRANHHPNWQRHC